MTVARKKKSAANSKTSAKPRGKPWPKGVSGNPAGRPPDGESWAGVLRWAAELTGAEAAAMCPPKMAREFRKLGQLKLKHAVTLRTFAAMLFDPTAGMFNAMMDRAEGKVSQPVSVTWQSPYIELIRARKVTFVQLEAELDHSLAVELFALAGVEVTDAAA